MGFLKIIFTLALITAATLYFLFAPSYATFISYRGETASISRDPTANIPTIQASSRKSFFYALGRVHAEDRLFQMSFKLLVVQGRLAEHLGQRPLPMDKFMLQLGLYHWGGKIAERLRTEDPSAYETFQAYVDGINDFASSLHVLPIDFHLIGLKWQNWTVKDVCGIFKLLEWSQSISLYDEYARSHLLGLNYTQEQIEKFLPNTKENWAFSSTLTVDDSLIPEHLTTEYLKKNQTQNAEPVFHPQIVQQFKEFGVFDYYKTVDGSNEWAISGKHTASGRPILAHDPHLQSVMPSQWYQIQAVYMHNGKENAISGISGSGTPFIFGKTGYFAAAITTTYMDNQDLYRETIKDDKYLVNGRWVDLKIREETIKVKTDKGIQEQVFRVKNTHRGPLISYIIAGLGSYTIPDDISLAWTGFNDQYSPIVFTSRWAQINDFEYAKHAILHQTGYMPNINLAFITADDHIGYQQLGRYPLRANPKSGQYVKDGSTTEHDWLGFMPPHHRIQVIDPPAGYIVNGNSRVASSKYYNGLHDLTIFTARADRLHQLLSEKISKGHKLTMEDAKEIVADTVDVYCIQMLPYIRGSIADADTVFAQFDCNFTASSSRAAMYEVFMFQLHHLIKPHKTDRMSILSMHPNTQHIYNYIKSAISDTAKRATLVKAWTQMKANLTAFFKTSEWEQWQWGKYHQDAMNHLPFSQSPLAFLYDRKFDGFGNMHTPNVGKMNKVEFGNFQTSHRANYRAIYSFAEENLWIIDSGSSEKFFSRHYDDQWKLFQKNEYLPLRDPPSFGPPIPAGNEL